MKRNSPARNSPKGGKAQTDRGGSLKKGSKTSIKTSKESVPKPIKTSIESY